MVDTIVSNDIKMVKVSKGNSMAVYRIEQVGTLITDVTVRESDEYSSHVYLRFDHHVVPEDVRGTHEIFLTPVQLEQLGRFLVKQADEIRLSQTHREFC